MPRITIRAGSRTVTIPEVAEQLGISESLAYKLARANRLPVRVIRVGKRLLAVREDLERLLAVGDHSNV